MPTLDTHPVDSVTKTILMGDSGSGKTGALASLLLSGYKLHIVDYDNGLDVLANLLRQKYNRPELLKNVNYETCTDRFKMVGGKPLPATADAWTKGTQAVDKFLSQNLDSDDILVLDSLSFASKAAMRWVLKLNSRLAATPQIQDWGAAQRLTEDMCALLFDQAVRTNVICICHIKYLDMSPKDKDGNPVGNEELRGYPEVAGRALSPGLARYFNNTLMVRGLGSQRYIFTDTFNNVECKNSAPGSVKPRYPLETGLADIFAAVRGGSPAKNSQAA